MSVRATACPATGRGLASAGKAAFILSNVASAAPTLHLVPQPPWTTHALALRPPVLAPRTLLRESCGPHSQAGARVVCCMLHTKRARAKARTRGATVQVPSNRRPKLLRCGHGSTRSSRTRRLPTCVPRLHGAAARERAAAAADAKRSGSSENMLHAPIPAGTKAAAEASAAARTEARNMEAAVRRWARREWTSESCLTKLQN